MAFSGGFFCQPRQPHARIENFEHIGVVEVKVREHYHGVKPKIGDLVYQGLLIAAFSGIFGSQDHLGGFFTDFLQNLVEALSIQGGDVRIVWRCRSSLRQHFIERSQQIIHSVVLTQLPTAVFGVVKEAGAPPCMTGTGAMLFDLE